MNKRITDDGTSPSVHALGRCPACNMSRLEKDGEGAYAPNPSSICASSHTRSCSCTSSSNFVRFQSPCRNHTKLIVAVSTFAIGYAQ